MMEVTINEVKPDCEVGTHPRLKQYQYVKSGEKGTEVTGFIWKCEDCGNISCEQFKVYLDFEFAEMMIKIKEVMEAANVD